MAAGRVSTSRHRRQPLAVEIVDRQRALAVPHRWLTRVCRWALEAEGVVEAGITLLLVDDAGIGTLHDRWLGDPRPTDVITFDLGAGDGSVIQGDIACSAETAVREAAHYGWPARCELAYYAIHGVLHLTGYDDRRGNDRRAMRAREREVFAAIGLPVPPRLRRRRP
ncbi:MAG: rRNA maturation RNase YbeY [Pirellulales bacterium]|jgi:probable rRNA maturation factor